MLPFLNEDQSPQIYSEAHAKERLNIQANYNKQLQQLNDQLAKQLSDCDVKYMKIAQTQANTQAQAQSQQQKAGTSTTAKQTGNVDTAGNPVNAQGNPKQQTVESMSILRMRSSKVNESSYNKDNVSLEDLQELKDYLDAENISYIEDDDHIEFDASKLDKEWKDQLEELGFSDEQPEKNILSIDDDDEDISKEDEKIDEDKVFYVKVENEGEAFVGKIYKLFDDGDWRGTVIDGESDTFEKLNYDPEWDEIDIIAFLRENYADAEIIDEDEFNNHVEEPEAEIEESMQINLNYKIPTLDEFVNEINAASYIHPKRGDKYRIVKTHYDSNPAYHIGLRLGTHTQNLNGTGTYKFKVGDIITYDDSNDWDNSYWITPDGERGKMDAVPSGLIKNQIIEKI